MIYLYVCKLRCKAMQYVINQRKAKMHLKMPNGYLPVKSIFVFDFLSGPLISDKC